MRFLDRLHVRRQRRKRHGGVLPPDSPSQSKLPRCHVTKLRWSLAARKVTGVTRGRGVSGFAIVGGSTICRDIRWAWIRTWLALLFGAQELFVLMLLWAACLAKFAPTDHLRPQVTVNLGIARLRFCLFVRRGARPTGLVCRAWDCLISHSACSRPRTPKMPRGWFLFVLNLRRSFGFAIHPLLA